MPSTFFLSPKACTIEFSLMENLLAELIKLHTSTSQFYKRINISVSVPDNFIWFADCREKEHIDTDLPP